MLDATPATRRTAASRCCRVLPSIAVCCIACVWTASGLADDKAAAPAPASTFSLFGSLALLVPLLLAVVGFFRSIEQNKDTAFRDLVSRLSDRNSSVVRAAAAGQLPDYFTYQRFWIGQRAYAAQVLPLLLHSLKKEEDLDVRQALFNSLVAITGSRSVGAVAREAGCNLGRGIDLVRAKLDQLIMDGFDFSDVDMTEASMDRCSAIGAKFMRANLWKAVIRNANLHAADLTDAKLWDATLEHIDFSHARLQVLPGALSDRTRLVSLDVTQADLSDAMRERIWP